MWLTILYVVLAFLAGGFVGVIMIAILKSDDKLYEFRHSVIFQIEDYYRRFTEQHSSAYERMIAKGVVQSAISIVRNTEV